MRSCSRGRDRRVPPDVAADGALVRLEATVRGVVQGVGFRWFVLREAQRRGLAGWVANDHDGSVRVVAEGPGDEVGSFRAALEQGPVGSIVERVSAVEMPATGSFQGFEVRSGGHSGD
jgi:acylphosphatase